MFPGVFLHIQYLCEPNSPTPCGNVQWLASGTQTRRNVISVGVGDMHKMSQCSLGSGAVFLDHQPDFPLFVSI